MTVQEGTGAALLGGPAAKSAAAVAGGCLPDVAAKAAAVAEECLEPAATAAAVPHHREVEHSCPAVAMAAAHHNADGEGR